MDEDEERQEPLMPLSMPPTAPPPEEPTAPVAPIGSPPQTEPLMPLSMPPTAPLAGDGSGSGSASPPPPSPPSLGEGVEPPPRRARRRAVVVLLLVALVAGGLGAGLGVALTPSASGCADCSPSPPPAAAPGPVPANSGSALAALVAAVAPSVVDIDTTLVRGGSAAGTGIVLSSDGEVLTNNHVVADASSVRVVTSHSGTYSAHVVGVDPAMDVALVQIDGLHTQLSPAHLGDSSKVAIGESVVALGNALGFGGQPTPATGIVTARGRSISASDEISGTPEMLTGLLQINAEIQEGDSGGPLIDSSGRVIGMDTAMATEEGSGGAIGFAIPIDEADQVVGEIRAGKTSGGIVLGKSAFLGVQFTGAAGSGAQIYGVIPSGPAADAGLGPGDVISAVGGTRVANAQALETVLDRYRPGDRVSVTYLDAAGSHTTTVTLGATIK